MLNSGLQAGRGSRRGGPTSGLPTIHSGRPLQLQSASSSRKKGFRSSPAINLANRKESVILIQLSWVRKEVTAGLHRLAEAERMVDTDPELMHGAPVYRGTRVPVHAIADMLAQGATVDGILEGYPALTREKVMSAPFYVKAFPRRGRPAMRPWTRRGPRRAVERRH
jgi:uncharacterized protein (DUF433 family)